MQIQDEARCKNSNCIAMFQLCNLKIKQVLLGCVPLEIHIQLSKMLSDDYDLVRSFFFFYDVVLIFLTFHTFLVAQNLIFYICLFLGYSICDFQSHPRPNKPFTFKLFQRSCFCQCLPMQHHPSPTLFAIRICHLDPNIFPSVYLLVKILVKILLVLDCNTSFKWLIE